MRQELKARDGLRVTPAGGSDRLATKDAYYVVHIRKTMTRTPNTVAAAHRNMGCFALSIKDVVGR